MSLPVFYIESVNPSLDEFVLNEETSRHIVQVLRMKTGTQIQLTDGKANRLVAEITDDHKKKCVVRKISVQKIAPHSRKISIAISPLKNTNRFEWLLEKATEIGVTDFIPLICSRTEKQHFRADRFKNILISAMLQSKQSLLPVLHEAISLNQLCAVSTSTQKFIAHCEPATDKNHLADADISDDVIILIGPEGDFTPEEISAAKSSGFIPVSLGTSRLRTETAGVVASVLLMR